MKVSIYQCAICKLEIWIEGEIVIIRHDPATDRSRCLMSGDRVPLMCPALRRALAGKTYDKPQCRN
jgi:hypothetical protein